MLERFGGAEPALEPVFLRADELEDDHGWLGPRFRFYVAAAHCQENVAFGLYRPPTHGENPGPFANA